MNEYHNFMHAWKFLEVWGTLFVAHQHSVHFRPSSQKPVLLGTPLTSPLLISRPQVPSSKGPTRLGQAQQSTAPLVALTGPDRNGDTEVAEEE